MRINEEDVYIPKVYDDVTYIEGVGTARETGVLDLERLVRRLLDTNYVSG